MEPINLTKIGQESLKRPLTARPKAVVSVDKEKITRLRSGQNRNPVIVEVPAQASKINKKSAIISAKLRLEAAIPKPEVKQVAVEKALPKISDKYLLQKFAREFD
jgi:hypothetical protein